jgi:hypothetical protein
VRPETACVTGTLDTAELTGPIGVLREDWMVGLDASAHHWNQARHGLPELFPSQLTVALSVADVADTPVGCVDAPAHAASSSERQAAAASLARRFVELEPFMAILLYQASAPTRASPELSRSSELNRALPR